MVERLTASETSSFGVGGVAESIPITKLFSEYTFRGAECLEYLAVLCSIW